jgi:hypothetical protein
MSWVSDDRVSPGYPITDGKERCTAGLVPTERRGDNRGAATESPCFNELRGAAMENLQAGDRRLRNLVGAYSPYELRRAIAGSIRAARHAGPTIDSAAMMARRRVTDTNVTRSNGRTPTSMV